MSGADAATAAAPAETTFVAAGGLDLVVRPLCEDDEARVAAFLTHVDAEDVRRRFFVSVKVFDHQFLWPLVHYDHRLGIAFVALDPDSGDVAGVARVHADAERRCGEFAILVRSDRQCRGLGHDLMRRLVDWARDHDIARVFGEVLRTNHAMLDLCRDLGFRLRLVPEDPGLVIAELNVGA